MAPPFSLKNILNNKNVELNDYKGKVVVLAFWASWCGPCMPKIPVFKEFVENNKSDPEVVFLSVSIDTNADDLKASIEKRKITYPVLADFDENSAIIKNYGIGPIPITYIINKEGKIREISDWSASALQKEVEKSK